MIVLSRFRFIVTFVLLLITNRLFTNVIHKLWVLQTISNYN